jgi:hypothetical protein
MKGNMQTTKKALRTIALWSAVSAQAQQYVISTYAGGAPPSTPVAAVTMAVVPQGMAVTRR